jgi:DNA polymerase-1
VGADYAQLEPRVFASFSKDERLLKCFADGDDFYSVIGAEVFGKNDCTFKKDDSPDSFPVKYKKLRDVAKVIALATPYGTTAPQMSGEMALKAGQVRSMQECQDIIDDYFRNYPSVEKLMLDAHAQVKTHGVVYSLFGRPRRIPEATSISRVYGKNTPHGELPRVARNLLNLAMNHPIQSTGASIMNRASIAAWNKFRELEASDPAWAEVKIILQVHDELILEGPEHLSEQMVQVLKSCMEDTVVLPGVKLLAEPKVGRSLADLK